ncbi:MAG: phosphate-starvation-inducible PsiE family protein [Pontimonas sp.]|nr:phosphate-starvation-inducible PsiE family protein [Pontimonas sp.]
MARSPKSIVPTRWAEGMEDVFHVVLGVFLFAIAVAALIFSVIRVFTTWPFFPDGMIQAINDILFIIIILEILRTVIARYTDGVFQLQNFLIIGIIAAVRHILTVGASMTLGAEKPRESFDRAVIELGISSAIVVALVFAIFLSKATESATAKTVTRASRPLKKK